MKLITDYILIISLLIVSGVCFAQDSEVTSSNNDFNPEHASVEFCECHDSGDKYKCIDEWIMKYKDVNTSLESAKKMANAIRECDPMGAMVALPKLYEASNGQFTNKGFLSNKKNINTIKAAEEFCQCKDSEDKSKCHDEWVEKYKDGTASQEDATKLGEVMVECDPMGAIDALTKFQEASMK